MTMTRKAFLGAAASGAFLLILEGCGGGGSDPSMPPAGGGTAGPLSCGSSGTAISGNHGHSVSIPEADLDSAVDMTYNIQGQADHNHQITLTVANLQALKAGQPVTVTSTTTLSHNHNVTSTCSG